VIITLLCGGAVLAALLGLLVYTLWVEPRRLLVLRQELALPPGFAFDRPVRLLHVSDLHLTGRELDKSRRLRRIGRLEVDLAVITGDFIETNAGIDAVRRALRHLKPPHGVYAVFGNHDYYVYGLRDLFFPRRSGPASAQSERLAAVLESLGVNVLRNAHRAVPVAGGRLVLIGLDDYYSDRHDLDAAFAGAPEDGFRILLSHSPDIVELLGERRVQLVLAGHTHGGQVRLPVLGTPVTRSGLSAEHVSGLSQHAGTPVHVTRGVGSGLWTPMRFRCLPEVSILYLCPAPAGPARD